MGSPAASPSPTSLPVRLEGRCGSWCWRLWKTPCFRPKAQRPGRVADLWGLGRARGCPPPRNGLGRVGCRGRPTGLLTSRATWWAVGGAGAGGGISSEFLSAVLWQLCARGKHRHQGGPEELRSSKNLCVSEPQATQAFCSIQPSSVRTEFCRWEAVSNNTPT